MLKDDVKDEVAAERAAHDRVAVKQEQATDNNDQQRHDVDDNDDKDTDNSGGSSSNNKTTRRDSGKAKARRDKGTQNDDDDDGDNDNDDNGNDGDDDDVDSDGEPINWWERGDVQLCGRGEKRWDTLSHNGVLFPPPYVPHGIPVHYDGQPFAMTPEEEEVATMFAVMREHDYYRNEIFRRNFFRSWRDILDKRTHPIRRLEQCNFDLIYQWHLREREKKLAMTKEEKKQQKLAAAREAEPYRFCLWDGRKEEVARYRVEPPGLFRGRGKHPLMGKLKVRVQPEDITINIGEDAAVPPPPPGHHWASVQHDHTVTWLAMWRDNVGGNFKYVMPAASSTVKGQSDMLKFEKARALKEHIGAIQAAYTRDFASKDTHVAQRAVAMYFIDKLALRVGNEKGSDEADTVGCCSLRYEHVQLLPDSRVRFDFLGKDSIRYQNEVTVLPEVYAQLARFLRGKRRGEDIFDELTPTQLNDYLKSFMSGLSAKVFRTYNASITLHRWFAEKPVDAHATVADKLAYFNKANTEVAILCNHQKSVSKNFATQMLQLTTRAANTRALLAALVRAREAMRSGNVAAAVTEFFAEQDRIQHEWLEAYGTEQDKQEYRDLVAKRDSGKVTARAMAAAAAQDGKATHRHKHSSSSKSGSRKGKKSGSRSSGGSRRRKKASPQDNNNNNNDGDDDDDDDDEEEKEEKDGGSDEDSDDDTASPSSSRRRRAGAAARTRKTASKSSTSSRGSKRTTRRGTSTRVRTTAAASRRRGAAAAHSSHKDDDDDGDNDSKTSAHEGDDDSGSDAGTTTATRRGKTQSRRHGSSSSSSSKAAATTTTTTRRRGATRRSKQADSEDDDEDDTPLSQLTANVGNKRPRGHDASHATHNGVAAGKAVVATTNSSKDDDDDDVPLSLL